MKWLLVVWFAIINNRHWITFHEDHIYVPCDWRLKSDQQQHRVNVKYEKVTEVSFVRTIKSSKNKTIQAESLHPFYHLYMVLHLVNGRKERIKIDRYSKKQRKKILEELKLRLEACGKNIDLTSAYSSLNELGMFGAKFAIDLSEKIDKKTKDKKDGMNFK